MTGPMRPDPRFTTWLSQQAPSRAPHDLLERSIHEVGATAQSPMHRPRLLFVGLSVTAVAAVAVALAFFVSRPSPPPVVGPAPSGPVTSETQTPGPTTAPSRSLAPAPQAAEVIARIALPNADPQTAFLDQVAVVDDTIWSAGVDGQELVQIDARRNRVVSQTTVAPSELVTSDAGELWTVSPVGVAPGPPNLDVSVVDPATGIPRTVTQVPQTGALAVGFGRIWVSEAGLTVRDAETGERLRTFASLDGISLTVACDSVWVWRLGDDVGWEVDRIDPTSGVVLDHFELPEGIKQRLVDIGGTCWTDDGVNIYGMTPGEPLIETVVQPAGRVHLTNDSAWVLYGNVVRRVDLMTGNAIGPTWELPEHDVRIQIPKVGADWHLLSADGSLWLLRNDELIRYAIPTS